MVKLIVSCCVAFIENDIVPVYMRMIYRLSQGTQVLQRQRIGRRLDMIMRRSRMEVGGGEAGKHSEQNDTKLLKERDLKLPKALKGMLISLNQRTSEKSLKKLTVVGMLQYGMRNLDV